VLYTCQNIQPIVNKLKEKTQETKNQLQIEAENIILGYHDIPTTKENNKFSNLIYSYKWEIWKNRNKNFFENKWDQPTTTFKKIDLSTNKINKRL
jgi:hypothetical protein